MNQIHTTFALGLVLLLNHCADAKAETSVQSSITSGAQSETRLTAQNPLDESNETPAEVLLTIKGPAHVKTEKRKQVSHHLIEQTAQEDASVSSLRSAPQSQSAPVKAANGKQVSHHLIEQTAQEDNSLSSLRSAPQSQSAAAAASSKTPSVTAPEAKQIAQRVPNQPGEFGLDATVIDLAKQWNVYNQIVELDSAHRQWQSTRSTEDTIKYLLAKQIVLADLSDLGFDVRRCTNAVDREIAKNSSKAAYLTELRDKAIRFNTYADFVAGGLTGVLAGALEMADAGGVFAHTAVDISEGIGQMGLSAWAFKAEHAGDRRQGGLPNVLAAVVDPDFHHKAYPHSVRLFLNTSEIPGSNSTRLQAMLNRWTKLNFCLTHSGHRMANKKRAKHLTGTHTEDATATIDLLEDRTAMLHDLRAEVTMMDEAVAELFDLVKRY